jgi:hypothetical protein
VQVLKIDGFKDQFEYQNNHSLESIAKLPMRIIGSTYEARFSGYGLAEDNEEIVAIVRGHDQVAHTNTPVLRG